MAEARKPRRSRPPKPVTAVSLDNAALYYLGRFASSSGNLRRVLMRKVARSTRASDDAEADAAAGARMVDALIERYLKSGLLDDRAYAAQAAASLARRGASRYAIAGKLAQKRVEADLVVEAVSTLDEGGASDSPPPVRWCAAAASVPIASRASVRNGGKRISRASHAPASRSISRAAC